MYIEGNYETYGSVFKEQVSSAPQGLLDSIYTPSSS